MQKTVGPISKTYKNQLLAVNEGITKFASEVKSLVADMDGMGSGSLGPDQVKEILMGVTNNLNAIQQKIQEVAEGVPASEGSGDGEKGNAEDGIGGDGESNQENAAGGGLEDPYQKIAPKTPVPKGKNATNNGDQMKELVATEVKNIMAQKEAKENIANEMAALVPPHMRQATYDEVMKSDKPIAILSATLEGMKLSTRTKVASARNLKFNTKNYSFLQEGSSQKNASQEPLVARPVIV